MNTVTKYYRTIQRDHIRRASHLPTQYLRSLWIIAVSVLRYLQRGPHPRPGATPATSGPHSNPR